ncbi:MAG: aminotransferase [Oscillospiraceae bacterium]|jgi:DNA-binding transcriptional MocR family regulator|nr:aminotransferase [Oscillospiraceae bacterium]
MDIGAVQKEYESLKAKGLKLDMSRGKPSPEQLDLSLGLLAINAYKDNTGADARNYGYLEGLPEARDFFAPLLGVNTEECIVGGNSSLELMYHCVNLQPNRGKWICPVPGYDRHFRISEKLGYELLSVPMTANGPDMDSVERLAADPKVQGIWCVPKYSNPDGYTYSGETVKRLASMETANPNFRVFWDNAYAFHFLDPERQDYLLNILDECRAADKADRPIIFCSTSKITFAGAGVAALGASANNIRIISNYFSSMTIGFDKLNQLRHTRFFQAEGGIDAHMSKHAAILKPKFQTVLDIFEREFRHCPELAHWTVPRGGYFISLFLRPGNAKKVVELCKNAGVILTEAGAAYPYGTDPDDSHIRIAPSYPGVSELGQAAKLLALSVKLAAGGQ